MKADPELESAIGYIAATFGADPSQPTEDDVATITRGIEVLRAENSLLAGALERAVQGAVADGTRICELETLVQRARKLVRP